MSAHDDVAYTEIRYEVADPVAVLTLDRPDALNAWTPTMAEEVHDALRRATDDPSVVGIVITGAGRGFCAGADLSVLSTRDGSSETVVPEAARERAWGDDVDGVFSSVLAVPKPVIAAINGPVAGMAVALILACDLRFMDEGAKLTTAFAPRGLIAEFGTSWLLPRLVGPAHALDLLLSGRVVFGPEAERMGLVNRCVPDGTALEAATEYVHTLAATCAPWSMATIKRQVYQQLHDGLGAASREAEDLKRQAFDRADFREGVASFRERRPPRFERLGNPAR